MKSRTQNGKATRPNGQQTIETRKILTASAVRWFLGFLVLPALLIAQPSSPTRYQYLYPLPNSILVHPQTNVIIRYGDEIQGGTVEEHVLQVAGSVTGKHDGRVSLSDDNKTIIFRPATPFRGGENVTVEIGDGVRTVTGKPLPPVSYTFTISPMKPIPKSTPPSTVSAKRLPAISTRKSTSRLSLPSTFPSLSIFENSTPAGDPLFLSNFSFDSAMTTPYLMILNRNGEPMFYRQMPPCMDFTLQSTGTLTYYDEFLGYFVALDSSYHAVDEYMCGNGYNTNGHELRVLPNGHAYLMAYDGQMVGMDTVVEGGNPAAMVFGLVIQEIDRNKEVVFEWRSWDHFKITDALREDLTGIDIEYVHGNAIEIERDGNILISSRNMDEVTKIDRTTGDIIWRLGGKNNQFTFVNDPDGFNAQHAIRRLANGHVTLFDNGTYRGYSRAVEYALDESTYTATLVWEYRHSPDILGWALGYAQRLPNGNTLVGWGAANPTVSEVTSDGREVYEMGLPEGIYSYRVYSFPWNTNAFVPAVDAVVFPDAPVDDSSSFDLVITNPTDYDVVLTSLSTRTSVFTAVPQEVQFLAAHESIRVHLLFQPKSYGSFSDTLDIWSEDETQGIVQRVRLDGSSYLPAMRTDQSTLLFGDVAHGASKRLTVRIFNSSGSTLLVDSIYTTKLEFVVNKSYCSVATVDSVTVVFTPGTLGDIGDTLYLRNNSAVSLMKVVLSGASPAPVLSVSAPLLSFASVQTGDTLTLALTLRNRSINPLTITRASVRSGVFAALLQTPAIIPGNDSLAAGVRFFPTSPGTFTDTLVLLSDGGTESILLGGTASDPTAVIERTPDAIPSEYTLSQNYPNPFNPSTTIIFGIPEASAVTLTVYDIIGRQMVALVNGQLAPGYYRCVWNAAGSASGMYLYRLTATPVDGRSTQAFSQVKKLLLMQ